MHPDNILCQKLLHYNLMFQRAKEVQLFDEKPHYLAFCSSYNVYVVLVASCCVHYIHTVCLTLSIGLPGLHTAVDC